jgi:surface protein
MGAVNYKANGLVIQDITKFNSFTRNNTVVKKSGANIAVGFQWEVDTTLGNGNTTYVSGFVPNSGQSIVVDWGDGIVTRETLANPSHTYSTAGTYAVRVYAPNNYRLQSSTDQLKVVGITDWGPGIDAPSQFSWGQGYDSIVTLPPSGQPRSTGQSFFRGWSSLNGAVNHWDVIGTETRRMFRYCSSFNQPVDGWDVSTKTSFIEQFDGTSFDQDLSGWDVSNCTDFSRMLNSTPFSGDVSSWDVSNGLFFGGLFSNCSNFNSDISGWTFYSVVRSNGTNTSVVTNALVDSTADFIADGVSNGDVVKNFTDGLVGRVTGRTATQINLNKDAFTSSGATYRVVKSASIGGMLSNCDSFDQPIGNWNTTNLQGCFGVMGNSATFNQPIGTWDTSFGSGTMQMAGLTAFNQSIDNWDVSGCESMQNAFRVCPAYNQSMNSWDVSNVTNMISAFRDCTAFNGDISAWDVSSVVSMHELFRGCSNFNADISGWNTQSVQTMSSMFQGANLFNRDVSGWSIASLTNASSSQIVRSTTNYDLLLDSTTGWPSQATIQSGASLGVGTTQYTAGGNAEAGRNLLTGTYGWTITDGGPV